MKIVIDIDKETYKMCKQLLGDADGIERAIANGIPLSKTNENDEPTICICPVCGSVWDMNRTDKDEFIACYSKWVKGMEKETEV